MIRKLFLRQLRQLLYSIGEVEGMISPSEEHELLDKVVDILSSEHEEEHEELKRELEIPTRPALFVDAAHALNAFLDFIDDRSAEFDAAIDRAFRMVAQELTGVYEV